MTGSDAYGNALVSDPDTDNDGVVSAKEAYDYANTNKVAFDTPIYAEDPNGCGDRMHLGHIPPNVLWGKLVEYLDVDKILAAHKIKELLEIFPPKIDVPPRPGPDPFISIERALPKLGRIYKLIREQELGRIFRGSRTRPL